LSLFPDALRQSVFVRAGGRCEYCLLASRLQIGTFPLDHIIPRSAGGKTEENNLALACAHCNACKWAHVDGLDEQEGVLVRLFHPRHDAWNNHFRWSVVRPGELEGQTPIGRATIARLRVNHPEVVEIRRLLTALGLFAENAI
jgi:hypothetical protein